MAEASKYWDSAPLYETLFYFRPFKVCLFSLIARIYHLPMLLRYSCIGTTCSWDRSLPYSLLSCTAWLPTNFIQEKLISVSFPLSLSSVLSWVNVLAHLICSMHYLLLLSCSVPSCFFTYPRLSDRFLWAFIFVWRVLIAFTLCIISSIGFLFQMGQSQPLFCLFSSFPHDVIQI